MIRDNRECIIGLIYHTDYSELCTLIAERRLIRRRLSKMVVIANSEAESLADFIALNLIQVIRDDEDVDSMEWLCNLCRIYEKCNGVKEDE